MKNGDDKKALRCAIYTRKSTSENLDMDFNTLDAQREAGEIFVKAQLHQGWTVLPDRYDDGGFTGGNMERPALKRLLQDIDEGKVDCVVVYKVDRLGRSLLDFARMMEVFEQKGISFVSTTQQFNTATPIGRLTLHLLLSFAQFEREMISERTRDKMAAARRRGKWVGGPPVLGYGIDRVLKKLEVIPEEAEQVKTIFEIYVRMRSMRAVMQQVNAFGWKKKAYLTKTGKPVGGEPFDENTIHRILRNRAYTGCVVYKGEVHEGEHDAIIDRETFEKVQAIIDSKRCGRGPRRQRNFEYILQGVLHCACELKMTTVNATGRKRQGPPLLPLLRPDPRSRQGMRPPASLHLVRRPALGVSYRRLESYAVVCLRRTHRSRRGLKGMVNEIGEDASIYFTAPGEYDQLLVFIWDNEGNSQDHDLIIAGLRKLQHVVDAVIVSRPGHMINEGAAGESHAGDLAP